MQDAVHNVAFVCTGNSARSMLAGSLMIDLGKRRFRAWSAGSQPKAQVHPLALKTRAAHRIADPAVRQ